MIQDIEPSQYNISFRQPAPHDDDIIFVFNKDSVLVNQEKPFLDFPRRRNFGSQIPAQYLFAIDQQNFYLYLGEKAELSGYIPFPCAELRTAQPRQMSFAAVTGSSLNHWYQLNRFCGRCGQPMTTSNTERAMVCPKCGNIVYPRISPAVIVAVTNGHHLLLTRYVGRNTRALVAGFCETGETVEDTVRREVMEETGLQVENLRYYRSQPWGFSDSLLMGFYCDAKPDQYIQVDGVELAEAYWVPRWEIEPITGSAVSLTQEMIELFRCGREPR